MDKINRILKVVVNKKGLQKATDAAQICYLANQWANGRFEAISFSQGCLKAGVKNYCQAQECQLLEEDLLDYLNEVTGSRINRIRWQIDHLS